MADINFYISGKAVPPPDNWQALAVELLFENNSPDANIKTTIFEWLGSNAATLYKWFNQGTSGGVGLWEGAQLDIYVCNIVVFSGCIDMTNPESTLTCDKIKASVVETTRVSYLADRTAGIDFSYLRSIGITPASDDILVPYVISGIPDYAQIMILSVSLISILHILQETVTTLSNLITKIAADITDLNVASAIADAVMIVLYVAYIIAMLLLVIGLIDMMVNNFIQPIKYKKAMRLQTLFSRACQYLGVAFSSTILQQAPYDQLCLMPKKAGYINDTTFLDNFFGNSFSRKYYDDSLNPNSYGYYEGSVQQFFREMMDLFNAKIVIRSGTLFFERWDFWNLQSFFKMPDISSEAPFQDPFGTNASELSANYKFKWALDTLDCNTYDQYDGTSYAMILQPNNILDQRNILLKGLKEVNPPFALAKMKTGLTGAENVVNFFFNIIKPFYNAVVTVINLVLYIVGSQTIPTLQSNPLNARIGSMLLCSDFTGVAKLFIIDGSNKISVNNQVYTSAEIMQRDFHSVSWAINIVNGNMVSHNQYLTFKNKEIPLCCADFVKLRDNNIIKDSQNRFGRIKSLRWNPHTETANIDFEVKQLYSNNLTQKTIIDGG